MERSKNRRGAPDSSSVVTPRPLNMALVMALTGALTLLPVVLHVVLTRPRYRAFSLHLGDEIPVFVLAFVFLGPLAFALTVAAFRASFVWRRWLEWEHRPTGLMAPTGLFLSSVLFVSGYAAVSAAFDAFGFATKLMALPGALGLVGTLVCSLACVTELVALGRRCRGALRSSA